MRQKTLMSWGLFPTFPQTPHSCYWRSEIPDLFQELGKTHCGILPFGNGRSYGDSCLALSDHVLYTKGLDRLIHADWEQGIVIAESGLTLEALLAFTIPHGWFLPVTPGTQFITLGGAVANDIHGKNHHRRGTFGRHVKRLSLVRSDRSSMVCSQKEHPDFFGATIGGLGLTGVIEWVEIQLIPISSSMMEVTHARFNSLDEFFTLSSELDHSHEYTVAWIDCLARGSSAGRGIYIAGDHSQKGKLSIATKRKIRIPFTPPVSAINGLTLRAFNAFYYRKHRKGRVHSQIHYEPFFYPLDRILNWNRIYGMQGFQQYQCVIPDRSSRVALKELLEKIASTGTGSFLAILKRCGDLTSPGWLSFPFPGVSLALDFPQKEKLNQQLFSYLDRIVREAGGRLYPAKDAHMSAEDFRHFYPAWECVEQLRDPALCSRFWKRVIR